MAKDTGKRSKQVFNALRREPEEAGRIAVGFRISRSLRLCLEEAAKKTGRSLSQETEHRLALTFEGEGIVRETLALAYGEDVSRAIFTFADTIRTVRTVSELAGISDANRETIIAGCKAGLTDLIDKLVSGEGGK
jgi:hypothetical protein